MGAGLQRLLGRRLPRRAHVPAAARQSEEARIVNTSSVNGFWATIGPTTSHTAYSAAKFAVKGFSEALITDLANTAPNVGVSVVMPGHIGTSIVFNSGSYLGRDPKELDEEQVAQLRERIGGRGIDVAGASDEDLRNLMVAWPRGSATTPRRRRPRRRRSSSTGVRNGEWRILVGDDAHRLDEAVRKRPRARLRRPSSSSELRAKGVFAAMPQSRAVGATAPRRSASIGGRPTPAGGASAGLPRSRHAEPAMSQPDRDQRQHRRAGDG